MRKECKPCRSRSNKHKATRLSAAEASRGVKEMGHTHGARPHKHPAGSADSGNGMFPCDVPTSELLFCRIKTAFLFIII